MARQSKRARAQHPLYYKILVYKKTSLDFFGEKNKISKPLCESRSSIKLVLCRDYSRHLIMEGKIEGVKIIASILHVILEVSMLRNIQYAFLQYVQKLNEFAVYTRILK